MSRILKVGSTQVNLQVLDLTKLKREIEEALENGATYGTFFSEDSSGNQGEIWYLKENQQ